MSTEPRKILILDDDFESMSPLKTYLELVLGYAVELTAAEGILDRLAQERYDLVLVDMMIHPVSLDAGNQEVTNIHFDGHNWRTTGIEFLRRLRSGAFSSASEEGTRPDVPVIVLSAVAQYSADELFKDTEKPVRHIEKPFDIQEMLTAISATLPER